MIGEELLREADRVADRLRVVLPRLLRREDDAPGRELLGVVREALQELADAAATAQGGPRRTVPELAAHAVPDQVLVLAQDLATGRPEPGAFGSEAAARAAHDDALTRGRTVLAALRTRL